MIRYCVFALLLLPGVAAAAERTYSIGSFDRLRVDGPFEVVLTTGASPGARAQGDARATDGIDLRVEGGTLVLRAGVNGWGEQPNAGMPAAPIIRLTTPAIRGAAVIGGGRLTITGPVKGQRIDLQMTGSGVIAAPGIDADQLNVTLLGSGEMQLGGKAQRARLLTSGSGVLRAGPLSAGDLTVRLDGTGETIATARFTATATSTGIGRITIYGPAACTKRAQAGGPILCGKDAPPIAAN